MAFNKKMILKNFTEKQRRWHPFSSKYAGLHNKPKKGFITGPFQ